MDMERRASVRHAEMSHQLTELIGGARAASTSAISKERLIGRHCGIRPRSFVASGSQKPAACSIDRQPWVERTN
jgi:hypothetical protein